MCPESRVKKGKENWGCENKVRICKIVQRTHSTQSGERVRPATFSRKMRRARVSERTRMNENLSFTIHNCINHMCRVGRRLHIFCVPSHKRIIFPLFVLPMKTSRFPCTLTLIHPAPVGESVLVCNMELENLSVDVELLIFFPHVVSLE